MNRKTMLTLATGLVLMTAPAMAENLVAPNCGGCHTSAGSQIWGAVTPGSQTESSFAVAVGSKTWNVRYDKGSTLDRFTSALQLPDDTAVVVDFRKDGNGGVYAEEISYKPSYDFHDLDNVITMAEVAKLLEKSPEAGNYMIVDARGYDNFIEGHLPNAVLIPYYELADFKDRLPADKNTLVVAYCRGFT